MSKEWNEPELGRHLRPVKAPEELWDRVQNPKVARAPISSRPVRMGPVQPAWFGAVAMVVIALAATWALRLRSEANLSNEQLAVRALLNGHAELGLQSEQPAEIRAWVKEHTGIDLPEQMRSSRAVRLYGARMIRKDVPTAEVSYRVGDMDVALVVSKMDSGKDVQHDVVVVGSDKDAKYQSWIMHGQRYTVAAADTKAACFLCHAAGPPAAHPAL
jgi:hypothetical protein